MIGGIEQVIEGHLEGVLNLLGVERQLEARLHQGDHRRDAKAADHDVVRQVTDDRHEALRQADLLARFAQCRNQRAAVGALDAPARETDLAGVIAQLRRALRDRKSTRLNSSHSQISYAVFCLKKKKKATTRTPYFKCTHGDQRDINAS